MKRILIFFLLLTPCLCKSQVPDHIPLMDSNWDILAMMSYKKNSSGTLVAHFPAPLKALDNKSVELSGYMVPIVAGFVHPVFMLSVLPVLQCQYCGQSDIPSMVEVHMAKPAPYSENPVKVKGVLHLNSTDIAHSEFILNNAVVSDIK
ncbi:hypothetical protein [Mucilaginibacter sp. UYCu711]|uniref:hypothetical protein n=1 Tax=Mucilaginibacter sp. UYCu711 TaxID=3156339 RepID=UPI003D1CE238